MKNKITAVLLIIIALLPLSAYAAPIDSAGYDRAADRVTVKGVMKGKNADVTIEVLKPGVTWTQLDALPSNEARQALAYYFQTASDGNGAYAVTFKMRGETGTYPVRVYSGGQIYENAGFFFATAESVAAAFAEINAQTLSEKLGAAVAENAETLGLDVFEYGKLLQTDKGALLASLLYEKDKTGGFSDVTALQKAIDLSVLLVKINNAAEASELERAISENLGLLSLGDGESYNIYSDGRVYKQKEALFGKLTAAPDFATIDGFKRYFGEWVVLTGCYNSDSWGGVNSIIRESKLLKSYSLGNFYSLPDVSAVCKAVNAVGYDSLASLAAAIAALSGMPVTSGGGGGGFSGGGVYSVAGNPGESGGAQVPPPVFPFSDMEGYAWAKEAVLSLYDAGVVNGRGNGIYAPGENVSREEFVKLAVSVFNIETEGAEIGFSDIAAFEWCAVYIAAGVKNGIIKGMGDGSFGKGLPLTRQDMAVIAYNTLKRDGFSYGGSESGFYDSGDISSYAEEAVGALCGAGIINGVGGNLFKPLNYVDRASAAKIIFEIRNRRGEK